MIYTRYIKQVLLNMDLPMVQYQYENVISRRTTSNNMTEITLRNGSIHSFPNEVFSYRSHEETWIFFRRPTEEEVLPEVLSSSETEILIEEDSYTDTKPDSMVIYDLPGNIRTIVNKDTWIWSRIHILGMPEVTEEMLKKYAYAKNGNRSSEHAWYYISTKDMSVRTKNANDSVVEIIKIIQSLGYTIHMKYIQNSSGEVLQYPK